MVEIVEVHEDGTETMLEPVCLTGGRASVKPTWRSSAQKRREARCKNVPKMLEFKQQWHLPTLLELTPGPPPGCIELFHQGRSHVVGDETMGDASHSGDDDGMEEEDGGRSTQLQQTRAAVAALCKRRVGESSSDPSPPREGDVDMVSPPKRAKVPGWSGDSGDVQSSSQRTSNKRVRPIDIENVETNMERLHIRRRCDDR